eukprot:scaffold298977_cov19-Tisochrysis_lutea.AAC.2
MCVFVAQESVDTAVQREASLQEEKHALKAALSAAISQKEEAEMGVAQGARELAALNNECINLKHQARGHTQEHKRMCASVDCVCVCFKCMSM